MKRPLFDKILLVFQSVLLAVFAALFLLKAYTSLDWRMENDTPLLSYMAFLMDKHGWVPYRDFFHTDMPVTFAFHYLIGKLFGYGDVSFRYVDLSLLGALLVATYLFMNRFGRLVAIWSSVLFGLLYLSMGQAMLLQRDYIGVIPIAFALLCIPARTGTQVRFARFALIGLLFGMSALVKPHLGVAFPIVFGVLLAFRWHSQKKSKLDFLKCAAVSGASLLAPISIAFIWLAANSALAPFLDMLFNYIPMYNTMTKNLQFISGEDRVYYLIHETIQLGGFGALFLASLFAYYHVVAHAGEDKASVISLMCLCLCTLAYAVYPTLAGKFWPYHYMPFVYFCSISAGLCFFTWPQPPELHFAYRMQKIFLTMAVVIAATVQLPLYDYMFYLASDLRSGPELHAPKNGRVDEIAGWLKGRLRPGDTVQPLDNTGGSVHGMLIAEAKLATQFISDGHLYHHVSSPYIQELRRSFMSQLRKASPRFIIQIHTNKPWLSGIDTTRELSGLPQYLYYCYAVAHKGDGYFIHERRANCNPS